MFGKGSFNIVKFMLSIMSMFFDIIFMIQRFILYPDAANKDNAMRKIAEGVSSIFQFITLLPYRTIPSRT